MKILNLFLTCIGILFIFSFSKESIPKESLGNKQTSKNKNPDSDIFIPEWSDENDLKPALVKFINEALKQEDFQVYLQHGQTNSHQNGEDTHNPEFIIIEHMADDVDSGIPIRFDEGQDIISILENAMNHWKSSIEPDQAELFQNIFCQDTVLVLKFGWWSIYTKDTEISNLSTYNPNNTIRDEVYSTSFFHEDQKEIINVKEPPGQAFPIYAKKAELLIKISQNNQ